MILKFDPILNNVVFEGTFSQRILDEINKNIDDRLGLLGSKFSFLIKKYYVSESGNDSNDGSKDAPFETIAKLNTLNLAGCQVFFEGGKTFSGNLYLYDDATEERPTLVSSYGTGRATINGGNSDAIQINGDWTNIFNINTVGAGISTGNQNAGIYLWECKNNKISHVDSSGFQKGGIDFYNCENLTIEHCNTTGNGYAGITGIGWPYGLCVNVAVRYCHAEGNVGDPTRTSTHSGHGIFLMGMTDSVIEYCTATNNGADALNTSNGPYGIWYAESENCVIRKCISWNNHTNPLARDGGGFDLDGGCKNCVVEYCLAYGNDGAGMGLYQYSGASTWENNIVRYNVFINNAQANSEGDIDIWNAETAADFKNLVFHNNIVYNETKGAVSYLAGTTLTNFRFYNNVFIGDEDILVGPASDDMYFNNLWYAIGGVTPKFRGTTGLQAWATATGNEEIDNVLVGINEEPQFLGEIKTDLTNPDLLHTLQQFKTKANSPLRRTALNIEDVAYGVTLPETDFFDNFLDGIIHDIGVGDVFETETETETETIMYINNLTTLISPEQIAAVDLFVKNIKSGFAITNLSDVFDVMYLYANETEEIALRNLVKNANHSVAVNSPTFTASNGFAGDGSTSYINSNFAPSQGVNYTQENASYGVYCNTDKAADEHIMSTRIASGNSESTLLPRAAAGNTQYKINGPSAVNYAYNIGTSQGMFIVSRNGTSVFIAKDGVIEASGTSPLSGLSTYPFTILARNSGGTMGLFTTREVGFAFAARSLTEEECGIIHNAYNQYRLSFIRI